MGTAASANLALAAVDHFDLFLGLGARGIRSCRWGQRLALVRNAP